MRRHFKATIFACLLSASSLGAGYVQSANAITCERLDAKCFHNMGGLAEAAGQFAQAVDAYRSAAELGFAESQMALGILYVTGKAGERSPERAVFWYKLAAQGGNKPAMRNLAAMYSDGVGVPKDEAKADEYREMAAKAGDEQSLADLINLYEQLDTSDRNVREKLYTYTELAAQQGDAKYQNQLGLYHLRGFWTGIDARQAHEWFQKSSEQGYGPGMMNLAESYQKAWGVRRDWDQAMDLYKKAFNAGIAQAALEVSVMYEKGMGTRPRPELAREWLIKAAVAGDAQTTLDLGMAAIQQTENPALYPLGYALLRHGSAVRGTDWATLQPVAAQLLSASDIQAGEKLFAQFTEKGLTQADLDPLL